MNMSWFRFCILFIMLGMLSACQAVLILHPMGDEPLALDTQAWQGSWHNGEIVVLTTIVNPETGELQATWLERKQDGVVKETVAGQVRRTGEWVFLNMPHQTKQPDSNEEKQRYFWARLRLDGNRAVLWWPNIEAFEAAVREGRLPGEITADDEIMLGELTGEHVRMINATGSPFLEWTEPMVFVRINE